LGFAEPLLEDQRPVEVECRLGTEVFDSALPICPKEIIAKAIYFRINQILQALLDSNPTGGVYLNLEDGVLNPLSKVLAQLSHTTQATWAFRVAGADVISYKD
jgi:hypothetical protein